MFTAVRYLDGLTSDVIGIAYNTNWVVEIEN